MKRWENMIIDALRKLVLKKNVTGEDMCDLMRGYRQLMKEGKSVEEINKILGIDPEKAPIIY